MKHNCPGAPPRMSPPFGSSGLSEMWNGPVIVAGVAPAGNRVFCIVVSMDRPNTSETRIISLRLASLIFPVRTRKSIAASHSAPVSSTSRAKSCKWRTSDVSTRRRRGSGVFS